MSFSKFSGQFVCTMAMLLAFVFAACSENLAGGTVEETGVYANLENITILGKTHMTKTLGGEGSYVGRIVVAGLEKGSVVSLYQLDPKSFAVSDSSITEVVDDEGVFAFQNVTLESPYVLISVVRPGSVSMYPYTVLADVRDSDGVNVDILTHLEALRGLYLVQSGTPFVQAKKQARADVLSAFGMSGVADDIRDTDALEYAAMISALTNVLPASAISIYAINMPSENSNMNKLFEAIAERGTFLNVDSALDEDFIDIVFRRTDGLREYFSVPAIAYQKLSDEWARDYQIRLRVVDFYAGMLAAAFGAGPCDQGNEGNVFEAPREGEDGVFVPAYNLVCRSGKWNLVHKEIEHSMGSMVDDRDGQVYKTTTIDINGVTQTWMAENLRYDGAEGASCGDDGCNYNFLDAMGLDSSYFIFTYAYESYEACVDSFRNVVQEPYGGTEVYCAKIMADPWVELDTTKVDVSDTARHQGVCPVGWRLSNPRDWKNLLSFVQAELGVDDKSSTLYLYDLAPFGNPAGIGLTARYSIMWLGHTSDYVPDPSSGLLSVYGTDLATAPGYADIYDDYGYVKWEDLVNSVYIGNKGMNFASGNSQNLVRCIKN